MNTQQEKIHIHFQRPKHTLVRFMLSFWVILIALGLIAIILTEVVFFVSSADSTPSLPYASLHQAVAARDLYAVLDYIEAGAALDVLDEERLTPYLLAVREGAPHIAMALYEAGASRRTLAPGGNNASHLAAAANRIYTLDTLCQHTIAPIWQRNREEYLAAHVAAEVGHTDIARVLVHHRQRADMPLDPTVYSAPLLLAAKQQQWETVAYLRIAGADYGLEYAIALDDFRTINDLLATNPMLLEQGNFNDLRPLHVAICLGRFEAFDLLLSRGADIYSRTLDGKDALDLALQFNRPEMAVALLEKGTSPNALSNMRTGTRRLHMAAQDAPAAMVTLLLQHGANIDAEDMNQHTALFMAVENNRLEVVRALLAGGATVRPAMLHCAREHACEEILALLEAAQQRPAVAEEGP